MRIRIILEFLKSELERSFKTKNSTLQTFGQCMLGTVSDNLDFEDYEGRSINIQYWDSGIFIIGAGNINTHVDYFYYQYTPVEYTPIDYQSKLYPKDSEEVLVKKINELLNKLHRENKSIIPYLPDDIRLENAC